MILDKPLPRITLVLAPATGVTEDDIANLFFTFSRTGATTSALTVNYTVAGTATLGADYTGIAATPATKTITFAAGSATATVTVDPLADTMIEPDETVSLTLAAGTGYSIGTTIAVVGTIKNDDPRITLAVTPATGVTEDGTANLIFTFSRTGATTSALTVNYTVAGTATLGADYTGIGATPATKTITFAAGSATATVTVDPLADLISEASETVALTLAAGTGYSIGSTTSVTGTLRNDDISGTAGHDTLLGTSFDDYLFAAAGNDTLSGNSGNDRLDGGVGVDVLTGGIGADTFIFSFQQSLLSNPDRITDFAIGADKIDLLSASAAALPAPTSFSRASTGPAATLASVVAAVFTDANGATAGHQPLAINSAALVVATAPAIAGTYLVINDAVVGFQPGNDLTINISGHSGVLPAAGTVAVSQWFV